MHELSIARALVSQATKAARAHGGQAIRRIRLSIGPLSGVEGDLLARAFLQARAGTIAATAELDIETPPIRVACRDCGAETAASLNRLTCADCGGSHVTLVSGDELLLLGLDLASREDANV